MKFNTLICDLDGVLWDVVPATVIGFNQALKSLKESAVIEAVDVYAVTGKPCDEVTARLYPSVKSKYSNFDVVLDSYEKAAIESIKNMSDYLYSNVVSALRKLQENNTQCFLISNCQDWYLEVFLEKSGLRDVFTQTTCYGLSGLPKAEMIKNMKQDFDLKNTVYIGDTQGDKAACEDSRTDFIWAEYGFGKNIESTYSVKDFSEVLNYFN